MKCSLLIGDDDSCRRTVEGFSGFQIRSSTLVQCATLFCTYHAVATSAALARVTLARMSVAQAVQMNGLGSML